MTIFTTPILSPILKLVSWLVILLIGWRPGQSIPAPMKKGILLAGPHTSNWDFALFLAFVFHYFKLMNIIMLLLTTLVIFMDLYFIWQLVFMGFTLSLEQYF